MCKLALSKTLDGTAYRKVVKMIKYQENTVAGHSTGIAWINRNGDSFIRKSVGKIKSFLLEYPTIPKTNYALGHSRYATVGEVNKENQQPIRIMYKGRKIGYGVHNGHWGLYSTYSCLLDSSMETKTDSGVLYSIYMDILNKYGDTKSNRLRALGTMRELTKPDFNNNFIIMFTNGQIIFSGNDLTYKNSSESVDIMTFGLENKAIGNKIYEVNGMNVIENDYLVFTDYNFNFNSEPKKVIKASENLKDIVFIQGKKYKLFRVFDYYWAAKSVAENIKMKDDVSYRIIQKSENKFYLYIRDRRLYNGMESLYKYNKWSF